MSDDSSHCDAPLCLCSNKHGRRVCEAACESLTSPCSFLLEAKSSLAACYCVISDNTRRAHNLDAADSLVNGWWFNNNAVWHFHRHGWILRQQQHFGHIYLFLFLLQNSLIRYGLFNNWAVSPFKLENNDVLELTFGFLTKVTAQQGIKATMTNVTAHTSPRHHFLLACMWCSRKGDSTRV